MWVRRKPLPTKTVDPQPSFNSNHPIPIRNPKVAMSPLRMVRWFAFLLVGVIFLFPAMAFADPVVDLVVTTNLTTSKEHLDAYRSALRDEVAAALESLDPAPEPDEGKLPPDGAARFRVFVEHNGTASVGDALKVFSAHPIKSEMAGNKLILSPDKTKYHTTWCLPYSHRASVTLRLTEWKAGKYHPVLAWTVTPPGPYDSIDRKGLIEVGTLAQDTAKAPIKFNPPLPKKLEEVRAEALNQVLPGEFHEAVCQGLVAGRILKVKKGAEETMAELTFQNKSPWPVKGVKVAVMTAGYLVIGTGLGGGDYDLEFAQPIAPGKSITQMVTGSATQTNPNLIEQKPGVTIRAITFDAGK